MTHKNPHLPQINRTEDQFMLWLKKEVMLSDRMDRLEIRVEDIAKELGKVKSIAHELYADKIDGFRSPINDEPDGEDLPKVR